MAIPTVTTTQLSFVCATTATGGGNVTSDGGKTITSRGICWGTSSVTPPTTGNTHAHTAGTTGSYVTNITGINTTGYTNYFVRAFASNADGIAYGNVVSTLFWVYWSGQIIFCHDGYSYMSVGTISGGTSAIQYSKDSGNTWQSSNYLSPFYGGVKYTVLLRDTPVSGCRQTKYIVKNTYVYPTNPADITCSIAISAVTSYGGSNGKLYVSNIQGSGMQNYDVSIDSGHTWTAIGFNIDNKTFTGLPIGQYCVKIRNHTEPTCVYDFGCYTITQPVLRVTQNILDSCGMALQKIKYLYIASRKTNGDVIDFPIDYLTVTGSSDSIIRVTAWSNLNSTAMIGGQELDWREVSIVGQGDNAEFQEEYQLSKQGKVYVKSLSFSLPKVNFNTNAALKEFIFTADGEFAISKAIAFIIDENNNQWIVGYDYPLILQDGMELSIAGENYYRLSFQSVGTSRIRNYQILP